MEMEASSEKKKKKNLERLRLAVKRLADQSKNKEASGESFVGDDDDDDRLLLSKLLSQMESLNGDDDSPEQPLATTGGKTGKKPANAGGNAGGDNDDDEIIKELKKVRKQNSITHWLISIMIFLTVTWQLSEVSLVMRVKDRVSHPFRSFGGIIAGLLQMKGRDPNPSKVSDDKKQSNSKPLHFETPSLSHLTMPELPNIELPNLSLNGRRV